MQKSKFVRVATRLMVTALAIGTIATEAVGVRADSISGATAGVQVQNLDANSATLSFQAIDQSGNTVKSFTDPSPVPGNSSRTYFPLDTIGLNTSFNGSLVVSSDKAVAAIANINATSGNGVPVAASYDGVSGGATSLTLPLIQKNNGAKKFDTTFNVQNAGQADTTVTVTYIPASADSGNAGCKQTIVIKPGSSATFNQNNDTPAYTGCSGLAPAGGKFVGSAKVEASGGVNIAAAVLEASQINLLAYTGFTPNQASTNPTFPLVNANNNGNTTGIQIANLGTQDTDVTVSYTPSPNSGTACTEKQTVKAGSSTTFALIAFANSTLGAAENCADGIKFVGSGSVTANSASQPLVAVINQTNPPKSFGSAYNSFNVSAATSKVSLPLILDFNGKFHVSTGISVVNVGKDTVDIKCVYSTQNGNTPAPDSATGVAPGSSLVKVNNNLHVGTAAYVGSAECTATGSGETKIIGVVNQTPALLNVGGAPAGDKLLTYEGFNH